MSSCELLRIRLRCDPDAPRLARQALTELPDVQPVREDALLVVSELASNAVLHSGCTAADELELRAELVAEGLRIEVTDAGRSDSSPARRERDPLEPGGLGLRVVETLARCWGSSRRGSVKVWAELALPEDARSRSRSCDETRSERRVSPCGSLPRRDSRRLA